MRITASCVLRIAYCMLLMLILKNSILLIRNAEPPASSNRYRLPISQLCLLVPGRYLLILKFNNLRWYIKGIRISQNKIPFFTILSSKYIRTYTLVENYVLLTRITYSRMYENTAQYYVFRIFAHAILYTWLLST